MSSILSNTNLGREGELISFDKRRRLKLFYIKACSTFLCLITLFPAIGQKSKKNVRFEMLAGVKIKSSIIYGNSLPYSVWLPAVDGFEQPGMHLAGPGVYFSERLSLEKGWGVALHQMIRYDLLYQRFSLELIEPPGFRSTIKRKIIFDLYADICKDIASKHSSYFKLVFGVGAGGLNTGHYLTKRYYWTVTDYTDYTRKIDFSFPNVTGGVGWQWKNLYTELKILYCWNDPTLFHTPFILPEISCQYKLFTIFKKKT